MLIKNTVFHSFICLSFLFSFMHPIAWSFAQSGNQSQEEIDLLTILGITIGQTEPSAASLGSIDQTWDDDIRSSFHKPFGLKNYGNTCYLNAITYLIANTSLQKLATAHDENPGYQGSSYNQDLKNSLKNLLKSMRSGEDYSHHQHLLKKYLKSVQRALHGKYSGSVYMQQDAAEFLELLLQALGAEGSAFEMIQREQVTYENGSDSVVYDTPYKFLRLPLEGNRVSELVAHYFKQETFQPSMKADDMVTKYKQVGIVKAPKTLIIQLKRFAHLEKNRTRVSLDRYLNLPMFSMSASGLSEQLDDKPYRLKALVAHQGPSSKFGHYVSYQVKYKKAGTYLLKYDDDRISRVPMTELESLLANDAYLLAYERKS